MGHCEIVSRILHYVSLLFLINFPKLDCIGVWSEKFHIFSLRPKPIDMTNLLADVHTLETVELSLMWLKLEVIIVLLLRSYTIDSMEDNQSSGFIPKGQHFTRVIKLHSWDIVFIYQFLTSTIVAKQLGAVVGLYLPIVLAHLSLKLSLIGRKVHLVTYKKEQIKTLKKPEFSSNQLISSKEKEFW